MSLLDVDDDATSLLQEVGLPADLILEITECCKEEWLRRLDWLCLGLIEENGIDVVLAFVQEFGVRNLQGFEDSYQGIYQSKADFLEEYMNKAVSDLPEFLVIDWELSFDNTDFIWVASAHEGGGGYVFGSDF